MDLAPQPLGDLALLARSHELLVEAVTLVSDDLLAAPTPCGDWDVAALLDHLTGGNRFTEYVLGGLDAGAAVEAAKQSFSGEHRPIDAVISSSAAQLAAFGRPGVLAATHEHVVGSISGEAVLRLRVHDVCIHIWDLRAAIEPGAVLDAAYVAWAIDEFTKPDSLTTQHMAPHGERPRDNSEVLAAFGRRSVPEPHD